MRHALPLIALASFAVASVPVDALPRGRAHVPAGPYGDGRDGRGAPARHGAPLRRNARSRYARALLRPRLSRPRRCSRGDSAALVERALGHGGTHRAARRRDDAIALLAAREHPTL